MAYTLDVDTNGAVANGSDLTVGVDTASCGLETADADAGRGKVARVRVSLEADLVCSKHALENLAAF